MRAIRLFKYIPKSLKNFLLKFDFFLSKTPLKEYLPLHFLYIEITSCCNLQCKGCYRTIHEYESKNKHMPLEDFKKYVDQTRSASSLYLHGLGEPTLNPDIKEMIDYASKSGKFNNIAFTTNALAKSPESYAELFNRGLTHLTISVDSLIPEEVDKIRPATDVEKLLKNITWLLDNFHGKTKVSMVINNLNIHTFEKTLEKLYEIGLREIAFNPYDDFGYSALALSAEEKKEFTGKLKDIKIKNMKFCAGGFIPSKTYCRLPSTAPFINVRGYLTPCCRVNDEKIFHAGNLKDKSFGELFNSEKYLKIQKQIEKDNYPAFCRGCMGKHTEK